jgi:membrane-bound lytic murein transglycosylase B
MRGVILPILALCALGVPAAALPPVSSPVPQPRPELRTLAVSTATVRREPSALAVTRSPRPVLRGSVPESVVRVSAAATEPAVTAPAVAEDPEFRRWIAGFRNRAVAAGIRPETFDRAFAGVALQSRVVERDRNQAEFSRTLWDYLDGAVSDTRVANGRTALAENRETLAAIERRYRVEAEVVVAIWGLESAYGAMRGSTDIVSAMATLAYDGRRRDFFEAQLIAALQILQAGDVAPRQMTGSWAGAMGHTQFMPTSYLEHAQDFNGDGRRDIWSDDPTDALASTAAYLAHFGWTYGQPWGVEVVLPRGFDYSLTGERVRRDAGFWRRQGVRLADGGQVPDHGRPRSSCPAGARGRGPHDLRQFSRDRALQPSRCLRDRRGPSCRPDRRRWCLPRGLAPRRPRPDRRRAARAATAADGGGLSHERGGRHRGPQHDRGRARLPAVGRARCPTATPRSGFWNSSARFDGVTQRDPPRRQHLRAPAAMPAHRVVAAGAQRRLHPRAGRAGSRDPQDGTADPQIPPRSAPRLIPETTRFRRSVSGATAASPASAAMTGRCSAWISVTARLPARPWSPARPVSRSSAASTGSTSASRPGLRPIHPRRPGRECLDVRLAMLSMARQIARDGLDSHPPRH